MTTNLTKIKVFFKMQGESKTVQQEVDTNRTVEKMINDFLEKKGLLLQMNDYSFMVNSLPLNKNEILSKKVKYIKKIRPNCTIQVRHIGSLNGGFPNKFKSYNLNQKKIYNY